MKEIRGRKLTLLIGRDEIDKRVKELGEQITRDFCSSGEFLVVGLLKGAFVFMADLVRNIDLPLKLDFLWVSSYGYSMESAGSIRILKDLEADIEGKDVLLVDDILDTGITLKAAFSLTRREEGK